ncbi:autotransporter outer membrane beta-barrel domain-containing protein [Campylobacter sp. RM16192]|uniref:autotransporter outer membrane beta-barrel domain-containing protein n=1 Tax=Campylobacter sp. RM16192 TaxID=1660080 RepID=UPI0014512975|nr:autotransporter outer membrane beta-barrel domain-containing protein [Campylobacter sp. RM16192]QCD51866.1 autotransporter domain protein [Campylobacter sp. RM16192]
MKFSKIACVALMSVALSSGAYANLDDKWLEIKKSEAKYNLANIIKEKLPNLFNDISKFETVNKKADVPESFKEAIKEILKASRVANSDDLDIDLGNSFKSTGTVTINNQTVTLEVLEVDSSTEPEITITTNGKTDSFKIALDSDELDITLNSEGANSALQDIANNVKQQKATDESNIEEAKKEIKKIIEVRDDKGKLTGGLIFEIGENVKQATNEYETALVQDANNVKNSHADYLVKNQDRIMAEKDKAITDAQKELDAKIAELNKGTAVSIKSNSATKVQIQVEKLNDLGKSTGFENDYTKLTSTKSVVEVTTAIANLKTAIDNGVVIKEGDKVLTKADLEAIKVTEDKRVEIADRLAPIVGATNGDGARKVIATANAAIANVNLGHSANDTKAAEDKKSEILASFVADGVADNYVKKGQQALGDENSGAIKDFNNAKKTFEDAVKAFNNPAVKLLDKTPEGVEKQVLNIKNLSEKLTAAKAKDDTAENLKERADLLKQAIDSGAIVKNKEDGNKPLTKEAIDAILASSDNEATKKVKLDNIIGANDADEHSVLKSLKDAEGQLQPLNGYVENISTTKKFLIDAKANYLDLAKIRANMITKKPDSKLSSTQSGQILKGLADIVVDNEIAGNTLAGKDVADVVNFANANEVSIKQAISSMTQTADIDIVKFSSNLSTNTRLAKLSNPFNEDLALAYAVKNLEGEKFADNGNSLSSVVKGYTDRYNYDNNLWGNIIGAKGKIKDGANPELYGFTLGYDKAFDNTIVGGFLTYAKSKLDGDLIENKANNYQIGLYTRTFVDNHEIDTKLSIGTSKNKLDRQVVDGLKTYDQKGDYKTIFASVAFDYGYVVALSDTAFVKPIIGVEYAYAKNKAFDESGKLPLAYNANTSKTLALKAAAEFRKYVENGNYLYITPGLESEIYKKSGDMIARFVGSTTDINFGANDKKSTYFTLQTGAEMKLTENLSTNINFGAKYKSKEQYYNGTLGLKYKF